MADAGGERGAGDRLRRGRQDAGGVAALVVEGVDDDVRALERGAQRAVVRREHVRAQGPHALLARGRVPRDDPDVVPLRDGGLHQRAPRLTGPTDDHDAAHPSIVVAARPPRRAPRCATRHRPPARPHSIRTPAP